MKQQPTPRRTDLSADHRTGPTRRHALFTLAALGAPLAGCGGGGTADSTPQSVDDRRQPLGINSGGTGVARSFFAAAVAATNPLQVAGVTFDTRGAQVLDDEGRALGLQDLAPGRGCQITASQVTGSNRKPQARASSIRLAAQLLAPLDAVDVAGGNLVVLGQRVVLTTGTLFDAALPAGAASLQPGQVVQVWGQFDSAGARFVATRVDLPAAPQAWLLRGVLSQLDRGTGSVTIGGVLASASAGVTLADDLAVGAVVRATLAITPAAGTRTLLSLRTDALHLPDRVQAELEGRITQFTSAQLFAVDGVPVDASRATVQATGTALGLGVRVEVEGRSVGGVLQARTVQADADELYELEGTIASADTANRRFVLRGVTISWDDATTFEGGTARLLQARRKAAVKGRLSADRLQLQALHIHVEA